MALKKLRPPRPLVREIAVDALQEDDTLAGALRRMADLAIGLMQERDKQWREAMRTYGKHAPHCGWNKYPEDTDGPGECTCGLVDWNGAAR